MCVHYVHLSLLAYYVQPTESFYSLAACIGAMAPSIVTIEELEGRHRIRKDVERSSEGYKVGGS